jgi:hypothetical protein
MGSQSHKLLTLSEQERVSDDHQTVGFLLNRQRKCAFDFDLGDGVQDNDPYPKGSLPRAGQLRLQSHP